MTLSVGILLFPAVQQLDLTAPYEVFATLPGTEVHLVWKTVAPLRASTGLWLCPSVDFAQCPPLDILLVPGGAGVNSLLRDQEVLDFLRTRAAQARYVASVCTGALLLGAVGLLRGRRAATHWNARDFLPAFGAIPVAERVVRDGSLFSAGGVTAGIDLALTMVAELAGQQAAQILQLSLEYAPAPPFDAGLPERAPPEVLALARARLAASRAAREKLLPL